MINQKQLLSGFQCFKITCVDAFSHNKFTRRLLLCCLIGNISVCYNAAANEPELFAPHKAFYTLKLEPSSNQALVAYDSAIAYQLSTKDCELFDISLEMADHFIQSVGSEVSVRTKVNSKESVSGDFYSVSSFEDDSVSGENQTVVSLRQNNEQAVLEITKPVRTTLSQPVKLEFPIGRTRTLIEQAKLGKKHYAGYLYEGSKDAKEYFYIFSSILEETTKKRVLSPTLKSAGTTDDVRSWKINSSYYRLDFTKDSAIHGDRKPDFNLKEEYFANGLVGDGIYMLDGMRIASKLNDVIWLEKPDCYNKPL